jgi:hypothetical protein
MATVEIPIDCELIVMGPPDPAKVILTITQPEGEWKDPLLVTIKVAWPPFEKNYSFGTLRDAVTLFVGELQQMQATGEGKTTLHDEDVQSYLRIRTDVKEKGAFHISGRFYSVLVYTGNAEPDPEEAGFFEHMWGFAEGFQGLRTRTAQLSQLIAGLKAAQAALVW